MKNYLTTAIAVLASFVSLSSLAQEETKQYKGHGITFSYDSDLTIDAKVQGVPTIVVKNDGGIQVMIQNYGDKVAPAKLSGLMVNQLKGIFKKELTELHNKSVLRTFFGKKREGRYLIIQRAGIPIEAIVFTFEHNGASWCIITQQAYKDTPQAEKIFSTIQASLKVAE
ncbi:MAG: hypothetical protein ACPG32_09160 [Akkermansiaceae bacterium]